MYHYLQQGPWSWGPGVPSPPPLFAADAVSYNVPRPYIVLPNPAKNCN